MAEAIACKEALSWLRGRGMVEAVLLTDCAQLHALLRSLAASFLYAGLVLNVCKAAMLAFNSCLINLVLRSPNVIAHTLASSACSHASILYWDSVPLGSISSLLH